MFTGIISALGHIRSIDPIAQGHDMRLVIDTPPAFLTDPPVALGASIACSGCCLTAVEFGAGWFAVDASAETLEHTKLGTWAVGSRVNLERSLRLGDELGGHLVSEPRFRRRLKTPPHVGFSAFLPIWPGSSP
jgi:riboflavin synthase